MRGRIVASEPVGLECRVSKAPIGVATIGFPLGVQPQLILGWCFASPNEIINGDVCVIY